MRAPVLVAAPVNSLRDDVFCAAAQAAAVA
jgi:hypothetical protein